MKTRKTIKTECVNDLDAVLKAQEILCKMVQKQPYCKHTVSVELSDGRIFELYANPRFVPVYQA